MQKPTKNKGGRPPKPPEDRKRNNLTIRIRDDTKEALEQAAAANGRSLSVEVVIRLEHSVSSEGRIYDIFDLAFGPQVAALSLILGQVMQTTGSQAGFFNNYTHEGTRGWLGDPYAFDQSRRAADLIFRALAPDGEITVPKSRVTSPGIDFQQRLAALGPGFAMGALAAIASDDTDSDAGRWAMPIRERLGPDVIARIRTFVKQGGNGG